jgi:thiol-disulfide isomerase/thioredoxin
MCDTIRVTLYGLQSILSDWRALRSWIESGERTAEMGRFETLIVGLSRLHFRRDNGIFSQMVRSSFSVLLLCVAGAMAVAYAETPGEVGIGEMLREATMQGLNGPSRELSEFRGRPLIINVWASWCGPCRAEMASLERLAWMDESQYFAVIGISTDDYIDLAKNALIQSNATINHFIDNKLLLENMLGASRLPLTVFVDADGRVLDRIYGARSWDAPDALRLIGDAFRRDDHGLAE